MPRELIALVKEGDESAQATSSAIGDFARDVAAIKPRIRKAEAALIEGLSGRFHTKRHKVGRAKRRARA